MPDCCLITVTTHGHITLPEGHTSDDSFSLSIFLCNMALWDMTPRHLSPFCFIGKALTRQEFLHIQYSEMRVILWITLLTLFFKSSKLSQRIESNSSSNYIEINSRRDEFRSPAEPLLWAVILGELLQTKPNEFVAAIKVEDGVVQGVAHVGHVRAKVLVGLGMEMKSITSKYV